jgi:hypothetical protein
VPFKVLDEFSGDRFIHYQKWQNQLLNIAVLLDHKQGQYEYFDNEKQSLQVGF